jgi:hypothetical protein
MVVVVVVVSNSSHKNSGCCISLLLFPIYISFLPKFFFYFYCASVHIFSFVVFYLSLIICFLTFIVLYLGFYVFRHTHTRARTHAHENFASLDSVLCLRVYSSFCGLSRLVRRLEGKVQGINFLAQEPTDYRIRGNVVLFLIFLFSHFWLATCPLYRNNYCIFIYYAFRNL